MLRHLPHRGSWQSAERQSTRPRLADVQEFGQDEAKALRAALEELSARLDRELAKLLARGQRVAIDGICWETAGRRRKLRPPPPRAASKPPRR